MLLPTIYFQFVNRLLAMLSHRQKGPAVLQMRSKLHVTKEILDWISCHILLVWKAGSISLVQGHDAEGI